MSALFEQHVCSAAACARFTADDPDGATAASSLWIPHDEEQNDFNDQVLSLLFQRLEPVATPAGEMLYAEVSSPRQWRLFVPALKGYTQTRMRACACLRRTATGVDLWLATAYTPIDAAHSPLDANPHAHAQPTLPVPLETEAPSLRDRAPPTQPAALPEATLPKTLEAMPPPASDSRWWAAGAPSADTPIFAPSLSLSASCHRLIGMRMRRPLDESESARINAAFDEGLSLLHTGGAQERHRLLSANVLVALASPGPAQLWACIVDAAESEAKSGASALAAAIVFRCGAIASNVFTSACF